MHPLSFFRIFLLLIGLIIFPSSEVFCDETFIGRPEISIQVGHSAALRSVVVAPDGKTVATGGNDNAVKLWDSATGELKCSLHGMQSGVAHLVFWPQANAVVAAGINGQICLWDVESGVLKTQWSEPDTDLIFIGAENQPLWTHSIGGQLKKWIIDAEDFTHTPKNVAIQNVGRGLLAYNSQLDVFANALERIVKIYDGRSGEMLKSWETTEAINALDFSPQGATLAVGLSNKVVQIWDCKSGVLQSSLPVEPQVITQLAYSPDGESIAIATALTVRLRNVKTGRLFSKLVHGLRLRGMTFSPDGKSFICGSEDKTAIEWDVATGKRRQVFGRASTIWSVALAPDGKTLAAASEESAVFLWDVASGELIRTLPMPGSASAVAFSPDGSILVISSLLSPEIQVWDFARGIKLNSLTGHKIGVRNLAFSPDGKRLASGGLDNTTRLWAVKKTNEISITSSFVLREHQKPVLSVAFSPDSSVLATSSADKTINCWEVANGLLLRTLSGHRAPVYGVNFAPRPRTNGFLLASISLDRTLRLWDAKSGVQKRIIDTKLPGTAVCFSPDGTQVFGNGRGSIYSWNVKNGVFQNKLEAHKSYVFSFVFLRVGTVLVSAGEDQIKLWDVKKSHLRASLVVVPSPFEVATQAQTSSKPLTAEARSLNNIQQLSERGYLIVTESGYYKGSAQADRFVKFQLGNEIYPAECFQAHYYRPDLVRRILAGENAPEVGTFKGARPPIAKIEEISAPSSSTEANTSSGEMLFLKVVVGDDSGVKNIAFFINGLRSEARPSLAVSRPLTSESRTLNDAQSFQKIHQADYKVWQQFLVELPLPPHEAVVRVQAIAFDEDSLQSPRMELMLNRPVLPPVPGKLLGLCVGVSRHVDERLNLRFPSVDGKALSTEFQKAGALYRGAEIQTLIDEQVTKSQLIGALDKLVNQTSRADTVILSLNGHGWRDEEGQFYFATHDVNRHDVKNTALPWSLILERLTQMAQKSRRVVVLLDACHSGSVVTNEELIKSALQANVGVMLFASSQGNELSFESQEWGHGAFTTAMLEALQGRGGLTGEKNISLLDFMAYVARRVKVLTQDQQHPRVPYLQDFETDGMFFCIP